MKMEPIVSSETSAIRTRTPGNYPKRNNLHLEHGDSLRTIFGLSVSFKMFGDTTDYQIKYVQDFPDFFLRYTLFGSEHWNRAFNKSIRPTP